MKGFVIATIAGCIAAMGGGPNAFKTMEVICHDNHFAYESTTVATDDGYVLTVGRIPGKVTEQSGK